MAILYSDAAIIRAVIYQTLHFQEVQNVYFVRAKNASIPGNEILLTIRDEIARRWKPVQSSQLTIDRITIQELYPVARDPEELAVAEVGAVATNAVPTGMAVVASQKTGLGGRSNRGRKYIAGLTEDDHENSRINPDRIDEWQAQATAIQNFFAAGNASSNLIMGIVHRSSGGAPVPIGAGSFVNMTSLTVKSILGTMRSRLPGHGN